MKDFTVTVPLYGYIEVSVEATSREEAEDKAMQDCMNIFVDCSEMEGGDHTVVLPYKRITQGNILFVEKNEIEVVEHHED
jgi:YbbR domain-containing protein